MSIWSDNHDYDAFILSRRDAGQDYAGIAANLLAVYGVQVTPDQVSGRYTRLVAKASQGQPRPVGPSLGQVYKNHVKVARAAIRLKHSIAADNELEQLLPALKIKLDAQLQEGRIEGLTVAEMLALVEG